MKVKRREHNGYTEYKNAIENAKLENYKLPFKCYFGKYQYIYTENKSIISLVKLNFGCPRNSYWEIFCLKGNLFDDVMRFPTKKEAVESICEIFKRCEE